MKLRTPAGEIEVSRELEAFFREVDKVPGDERMCENNIEINGYMYSWSFIDGQLRTKITLIPPG